MDKYEKKILELELAKKTPCVLNHEDTGIRHAIDYITQNIGYTGQSLYEITIPVCEQCIQRLQSPQFTLLYCLQCADNRWIYQPTAKLNYAGKRICWMSCCPECAKPGEKANVFFTD